jgi:hypothetical protein
MLVESSGFQLSSEILTVLRFPQYPHSRVCKDLALMCLIAPQLLLHHSFTPDLAAPQLLTIPEWVLLQHLP